MDIIFLHCYYEGDEAEAHVHSWVGKTIFCAFFLFEMYLKFILFILLKGLSTQGGGDPPLLFPNSEKKQNSFNN